MDGEAGWFADADLERERLASGSTIGRGGGPGKAEAAKFDEKVGNFVDAGLVRKRLLREEAIGTLDGPGGAGGIESR